MKTTLNIAHGREISLTDNESTASKGTIQGYNCQTASDEKYQIVIASQAIGVGQDQTALKPMIEEIKFQLGESVLNTGALLTADTGYSSEANMEYVFGENINAIIPDNNFRQRDPKFSESDTVKKHKAHRQKTRKYQAKGQLKFPASNFTVNTEAKICVCPNGHEMVYHGDHFIIGNKRYLRFKSYLKNCRDCPLQSQCMKNPVKEHGRQVSFAVEDLENVSYLNLMKKKIMQNECGPLSLCLGTSPATSV